MIPIIAGINAFMKSQLTAQIWDGEIPRYDPPGNPINPDQSAVSPTIWPVIRSVLDDAGQDIEWTMLDSFTCKGPVTIEVWGTSRLQLETPPLGTPVGMVNRVAALWAQMANWQEQGPVNLGSPQVGKPNYIIHMLLKNWTVVQLEGVRLAGSQLCYYGRLTYEGMFHGSIPTS